MPFEPGTYNPEATIGENLRFGTANGPALADKALSANPYIMSVLKEVGLDETLYDMGLEIASNAIELFADLPPDNPLFQQLTFMTPEEIPDYQILLQRLQGRKYADASTDDRAQIITLSFAYIEPRHRFGLLTAELMDKIVEARNTIYEGLPEDLRGSHRALRSGALRRRGQPARQRAVRPHRPPARRRAGAHSRHRARPARRARSL